VFQYKAGFQPIYCPSVDVKGIACDEFGTLHQILELTIPQYHATLDKMRHVPRDDQMPSF